MILPFYNKINSVFCVTKFKRFLLLSLCLFGLSGFAQFGGESVYSVLTIAPSSRIASLGGTNVSMKDGDLSFGNQNPSLIDSSYSGQLAASFNVLYGMTKDKITATYAQYAKRMKKNTYSVGLYSINYGHAQSYDEFGNPQGTVGAGDYLMLFSASRPLNRNVDFGFNLKPIVSQIANYTSVGMLADLGFSINDTAHLVSFGLSVRNFGYQIKTYTGSNRANMPMQMDIGFTKRFAHAPFRISATYTHLETFDLSYPEEKKTSLLHTETSQSSSKVEEFGSSFLSHWVLGLELLLPRNISLAAGLNFRNRNDLKLDSGAGATGFSFGAGLKFKRIYVNYAYVVNHAAVGSTYFSARTNIDSFFKKTENPRM